MAGAKTRPRARPGCRVGEKLEKALPDDPEQAGAALQQAIAKRPRVRAAAEAVGIRAAGQIASAERIMARVQEAVELFKMKRGDICDDVSMALNSFFTLAAPEKNEDALVRGRQAKRARLAGEKVPVAKVTGAREYAAQLGISVGAAWNRLRTAIERRDKLSQCAEGA